MENSKKIHVFYVRTAFQYFFCCKIIEFLDIDEPRFITRFSREFSCLEEIKKKWEWVVDLSGVFYLKKRLVRRERSILRAYSQLGCSPSDSIEFYSAFYCERDVNYFISLLKRKVESAKFHLFPDGVNLLLQLQGNPEKRQTSWLGKLLTGIEYTPVCLHHNTGVYSDFISNVYHFPAENIFAPSSKIVIIDFENKVLKKNNRNIVLLLGGELSVDDDFFDLAGSLFTSSQVIYKAHPKFAKSQQEQALAHQNGFAWFDHYNGPVEEYLAQGDVSVVAGAFSTTLVYVKLFMPQLEVYFLFDDKNPKDCKWRSVAESVGIDIVPVRG